MTDLREELTRIAERAPSPRPYDAAHDAWRRGRRARRRDRAVVLGVVAAVLVVVGGTASLLVTAPTRIAPAAPVDAPAAVPTDLRAVPDHVLADPAFRTSDLAIGVQAAAFTSGGLPVAVSATDGSYRILDLPGWNAPGGASPSHRVALSPDGRQLAWAYLDPDGETGVRTVTLEDGTVREIPVVPANEPGPQQEVLAVTWSPDSGWLVWASGVIETEGWVSHGRVAPGSSSTRPWPARPDTTAVLAGDDAVRGLLHPGHISVNDDEARIAGFTIQRVLEPTPVAAMSPDGTRVAVGSTTPNGAVDVVDLNRMRVRLAYFGGYDEGQTTYAPLGWLGADTIAVAADVASRGTDIVLVPAPGNRRDGEAVVARVEDGVADLTVAVDLLDRPTVDRPGPDWPWSEERQRLVLAGAGLLVLLAVAAAVVVRRRPAR
ncbi:hypothetical protein GCM10009623_22380 [Nocardioides aestuarii]|uniref:WD40 repeat domain-containing protein n=1 Tax=Nocardioides aestuarii TaxID=252231 RepID=A0ABW4TLA4_9ACTN